MPGHCSLKPTNTQNHTSTENMLLSTLYDRVGYWEICHAITQTDWKQAVTQG